MALCSTTNSIKLEAVKAFWGIKHCRSVTTVADVADSLDGTYFELNVIEPVSFAEVKGYVYFGTDPVLAGKTAYNAGTVTNFTANQVASAIESALASVDVKVEVVGNKVEIQNKYLGQITAEVDGGSGFTFAIEKAGIGGELGKTSGGSTLSMEAQGVEYKSDQTGEIVLGESYIGSSATIEMALIEVDKEKLELIVGQVTGDVHTPIGGTSLVGYGESKLYQLMSELGGTLILHPIRLLDSDKSGDYIFHKCAPMPQDINFSGTEVQTLNVTFKAYLDSGVNKKINLFAIGDWTQDLE
jgi:hypothetical protein